MTDALGKNDFEDLSAFLDGELTGPRADEVARLVREEPAWRAACAELKALDSLLDAWSVPAPEQALPGRVLQHVRAAARTARTLRIAGWAAAAAAAAAVLLAVLLQPPAPGRPERPAPAPVAAGPLQQEVRTSEVYAEIPQAQRAELEEEIVRNYELLRGLFEDFDVVADMETLEAIEQLEEQGT